MSKWGPTSRRQPVCRLPTQADTKDGRTGFSSRGKCPHSLLAVFSKRQVMSRERSTRNTPQDERSSPSETQSSGTTVLYVDGDSRRRAVETSRLADVGDSVEVRGVGVESGESLVASLSDADCVVSRYELPETDGIERCEQVRDHGFSGPFVLAVSEGSEQLASEATAAGVSDYVPVDGTPSDRLFERLADVLADHRSESSSTGLGNAVEHAADAVLITDPEGTIEYVNPAFEELTGFSRAEAIGRTPRILKSGQQDRSYYQQLWTAILDGEVWEEEVVNETKDGEEYIAHQIITPVTDADGNLEQFVGIQRDVTRRRTLEEQIERSAETFERLYTEIATESTDLQSRLQSVLKIGSTTLGYQLGYVTRIDDDSQRILAAVGDHEAIQPGASDPLERTYCRRTIESDEPTVVSDALEEGWADDPAFETFGLRCYVGAQIVVDGELFGTLCFGGEEPEQRLVLEAQQSTVKTVATWLGYELERHAYEARLERQNAQLEQFASVASHDLRNPLNVAAGHLDLAQETGADDHFETVATNHDRMASIIKDVLVLAREGTFVEETEPVALDSLAVDCWEGVETGDAELVVDGEPTVEGDARKLRHVFENLFRNSVEHAGENVTVEVGSTDDSFYIADDGPGIPESEREAVFEHGYSGSDGTGFGLAIVESIAEAHGWTIRLTESQSGGARFEFVTNGPLENGPASSTTAVERLLSTTDES